MMIVSLMVVLNTCTENPVLRRLPNETQWLYNRGALLTLLHSERSKLHRVLAIKSAIGLIRVYLQLI